MPVISELRDDIKKYIKKHGILKKWEKAKKLFENNMNRLGVPQDRIAKRLGQAREMIRDHLAKMPVMANPPNSDLSRGFTVSQVAEKHNWTEPMVWSLALEDKEDLDRFKEIGWGLRTWDQWEWNDCGRRIRQRGNPDRRLPQDSEQNRLAAHPHHPGPHVRTTIQRRSRLRNAEKKNTWCYKQVCNSFETVVSHECG